MRKSGAGDLEVPCGCTGQEFCPVCSPKDTWFSLSENALARGCPGCDDRSRGLSITDAGPFCEACFPDGNERWRRAGSPAETVEAVKRLAGLPATA